MKKSRKKGSQTEAASLVYTVDGFAKLFNISRAAAYQAVKRGEVPSIRIGRRLVIPKAGVDRMLAGNHQPEKTDASV